MLSFVRNRQTIFQAVLLFSIPTSNEWRWTHLINSFFNKQVVSAKLPTSELIFHITFFRPPFLGEWPHSSPGHSCVSSSLFHANELAAKLRRLSHLQLSEICSSSLSFQPSSMKQPPSGLPLLYISGSCLPKYHVASLLQNKTKQNLKFSHWLQVKLPTALDGL